MPAPLAGMEAKEALAAVAVPPGVTGVASVRVGVEVAEATAAAGEVSVALEAAEVMMVGVVAGAPRTSCSSSTQPREPDTRWGCKSSSCCEGRSCMHPGAMNCEGIARNTRRVSRAIQRCRSRQRSCRWSNLRSAQPAAEAVAAAEEAPQGVLLRSGRCTRSHRWCRGHIQSSGRDSNSST